MFRFARMSALKNLSLKRVTLTALALAVLTACGAVFTTQASADDYYGGYGGRRYVRRPVVDPYCPYDRGYRHSRRYYGRDYGVGRGYGGGYYGGYGGGFYGGRGAIAPRIGHHPHGRRPRIGLYLGF